MSTLLPYQLPDYDQWAEDIDRKYRESVLLRAARILLASPLLPCTCDDATCQRCVIDRVIAETDTPAAGEEEMIDLAELDAISRQAERACA